EEGLSIKALDVDQSSMIDVFFPKGMFLEYDIADIYNIGISANNIGRIFKHIKKGENLAIEPEGDYVKFNIGSGGILSRKYKFRNLDIPLPEIPELSLNFTVTAKIMAQSLNKAIEDIEAIGGNTEISATQDALIIRSSGTGRVETKFSAGSQALINLEVLEPASSIYDTAKIVNILGISKVSDMVSLQFANKMPQ
ncbi:MAG: DNA polymerase sliding clamp, partial [Desulfurococcaceae archaeon]